MSEMEARRYESVCERESDGDTERERYRDRERGNRSRVREMCMCVCERDVCVCVRERCVCVRERDVCVCERERERSKTLCTSGKNSFKNCTDSLKTLAMRCSRIRRSVCFTRLRHRMGEPYLCVCLCVCVCV